MAMPMDGTSFPIPVLGVTIFPTIRTKLNKTNMISGVFIMATVAISFESQPKEIEDE
jgi:hypothetical protein